MDETFVSNQCHLLKDMEDIFTYQSNGHGNRCSSSWYESCTNMCHTGRGNGNGTTLDKRPQ
eukprot:CAMPEP_0195334410 /NCGR_PEP_ID=MMETSP0708-20121125/14790_1 /TAXON_ID=33640 /ORGANISM="Asterionellopsis glacialis, Strain CCMP134" /LENGTH=60 /DNA_ID=CAMNT_0040404221 /DNA_START=514 /DNA_END=696 /DNA_ORIENTATION=-